MSLKQHTRPFSGQEHLWWIKFYSLTFFLSYCLVSSSSSNSSLLLMELKIWTVSQFSDSSGLCSDKCKHRLVVMGQLQWETLEKENHSLGLHPASPTQRTTPKIQLAYTAVSITVFISGALEIWGTRPLWREVQLNFSAHLSSIVDVGTVVVWFWLFTLRNIYKRWSVWTRLAGFRLKLVDLLFSVLVTAEELA